MFDWSLPYVSRRAPVFARNAVATSQPLATQAGIDILRRGGNAVDAAIATAITLTVVEPAMNGVGSDAFAIVWDGQGLTGINGSGKSPAAWKPDRFKGLANMPTRGWDSVTVPGAVSTWTALSKKFGKLPFGDLFEPAIRYARDGFLVGTKTASVWSWSVESFADFGSFQEHFAPQGRSPGPGEVFQRSDLVETLTDIGRTEGESIYRGRLADAIVRQSQREGGVMTHDDLDNHSVLWTDPIGQPYREVVLHEIPPNGQGLAAQIALSILEHLDVQSMEPGSVNWIHHQVEAMKIAIRAAFEHFADPDAMEMPPSELLEPGSIARAANAIATTASQPPPVSLPVSEDTVYLTTADADGCMVSMIQSNYRGFGSGIVIDGTGISMQNRGSGFVLTHGHPNEVAGGKRPFHTIIPGFVTHADSSPAMAFGVMGGHMQHQGHVQMVTRVFDHGENPQAASDAPRWHVSPDYRLALETGTPLETIKALNERGHDAVLVTDEGLFGGAQLICPLKEGYCAASDHRKEGMAAGF